MTHFNEQAHQKSFDLCHSGCRIGIRLGSGGPSALKWSEYFYDLSFAIYPFGLRIRFWRTRILSLDIFIFLCRYDVGTSALDTDDER